jgi:hypothetical protein
MSTLLREFVLNTLTSPLVDNLNFRFGSLLVYPTGYRNDIAGCIRNGHIRLTSNPTDVFPPGADDSADGVFVPDTPAGQSHWCFIHPRWTEMHGTEVFLKNNLARNELASLRGTVIHESTHALQDFQRLSIPPMHGTRRRRQSARRSDRPQVDPRAAEGAAYLAGAIAKRLWGFQSAGPIVNPRAGGHAYALSLADRFLAETNVARRYVISTEDVMVLMSLVTTGSPQHYVFNGI